MKKNGFTLMELLGVIMILAVLAVIAFPPIITQIKKSKQEIKNSTKILITDSAKDYYEDNINNFEQTEGMTYCIDLSTLINQGYLNGKLKDEELNNIDITKKVKMIYHNSKFDYDVVKTCTNGITLTRNNIEVPIVTEGKGLYASTTEEGRYIYRGGDETNSKVNNFIKLKENGTEETYRILSFESDGTIKVVRDAAISKDGSNRIKWDNGTDRNNLNNTYCNTSNGCNAWGNQSNTYYNGKTLSELNQDFYFYYYTDNQATNFSIKPNSNYGTASIVSSLNTYLNNTWINTLNFKDKIETHSFDVGGVYYDNRYNYSGGSKELNNEKQEEKTYVWNGKVALMNITEFVETSLNDTCTSVYSNYYWQNGTQNGSTYTPDYTDGNWPCALQNWNYKPEIHQWTLSAHSINSYNIWLVHNTGYFGHSSAYDGYRSVRPAFYLKASTSLKGEGTEANPFRLVGE